MWGKRQEKYTIIDLGPGGEPGTRRIERVPNDVSSITDPSTGEIDAEITLEPDPRTRKWWQ